MGLELFVDIEHAVAGAVQGVADFDIVVIPAELLVGLRAGQELGAAEEVANAGN